MKTSSPGAICCLRFSALSSDMNRREQWRKVLDFEVQRLLVMTYEQLVSSLRNQQIYEVECDSKMYQVEIEILENTEQYIHLMVAVDDGSLPASILLVTHSFIRAKPGSCN
jgi:hypothetical protein